MEYHFFNSFDVFSILFCDLKIIIIFLLSSCTVNQTIKKLAIKLKKEYSQCEDLKRKGLYAISYYLIY